MDQRKKLTPIGRSENMRRIRGKDTKPELLVRQLVSQMGYRYRLHRKDLPGKPDLAFIGRRKAIFVHGCFWHQHQKEGCNDARLPRTRLDYWVPKLQRNQVRDAEHLEALRALGWTVLEIWDCETKDLPHLVLQLQEFLQ